MHRLRLLALLVTFGSALGQNSNPVPQPPTTQSPSPPPPDRRQQQPPPGGMPFVHDPSTVIEDGGKYYVYTTGRGIPMLSSPDKVNWTSLGSVFTKIPDRIQAAVPKNNNLDVWAPDIIKIGNRFYLYYAVSSWGSFRSAVALATNTTLDPANPAYQWVDQGVVALSDGVEDMNNIDPGVILAPDGTLWICFGSYHGSINLLELDPNTGLARNDSAGKQGIPIARQSEAADIIHHGDYFYLFVNHGSCCQGKKSEYNIRVGRSRAIQGPYLDKHGVALTAGGGSLFLAAHDHRIGPGHFGRVIEEDGNKAKAEHQVSESFSLHYEADLTNLGRPTLGIRPLLWSSDQWPVAGDTLPAGNYQIVAKGTEDNLDVSAIGVQGQIPATLPNLGRYRADESQQWKIEPAGRGFYNLTNLSTKNALSADEDGAVQCAAGFNGSDAQLWMLDQLTDGSYKIVSISGVASLTRTKQRTPGLTPFSDDDDHRWYITSP